MVPIYIIRQINHFYSNGGRTSCYYTKRVERSGATLQAKALLSVIVRCITALEACEPALPHPVDAGDDYPRLIFHHHFEPMVSLAEQALQTAGLVALLTT